MKAAFDFTFTTYATPGLVKIVYVLGVALVFIGYVLLVIFCFAFPQAFVPDRNSAEASFVPAILAVALGWIPGLLMILLLRVALEATVANVRTAVDTRALLEQRAADPTQ